MMYDIGIIGGGTAGMTAAIYGQRAGKRTVIIEAMNYGGQITSSPNVENYPGIASVSGAEFSMNMLDQAMKLGAETELEQVTGIREEDGIKVIETEGKEYPCRTVIIATGVTHRHLGLEKEEKLVGAGVSYCATCDGAFFRNKVTAVVGGGDVALEDAIFLSRLCEKVYLIHRRDELRGARSLQEEVFARENIEILWDTIVEEIQGEEKTESLKLYNKKTKKTRVLEVQGVFIAVGIVPASQAFSGLTETDHGYIKAGEDTATSVPGIFAAGDVRTKQLRQIVTAVADGANAVTSVEQYLREQEKRK